MVFQSEVIKMSEKYHLICLGKIAILFSHILNYMNIVVKKQAYRIPNFCIYIFLVGCGWRYKRNNDEKRVLQYFCEALHMQIKNCVTEWIKKAPYK